MSDTKEKGLRILDVKAFEIASHFVSKDSTRFNINGIRIDEDGGITATDGHIMFHMPKCVEPPPLAMTVRLSKAFSAPKKDLPVFLDLERCVIDIANSSSTGEEWKKGQLVQLSQEDFCDYKKVMPDEKERQPIASFNMAPKLLARIAKSLGSCLGMTFYAGKDELSVIQIEVSSLPDATIIIMPMRI